MTVDARLAAIAAAQPYPLLFATLSGAHLYGFPSPDSDYDVRGAHILPARDVLGLGAGPDTIEVSRDQDGLELDLVTHDVKKFFGLMLKANGYVLEQLTSPLVVATRPEHEELKRLARGCVTRRHAFHYLRFAEGQWKLLEKKPRVKQLLYIYRVLLTGAHLMRTDEIEANLVRLNEEARLACLPDLIGRKLAGREKAGLEDADFALHRREFERLCAALQAAHDASKLPDEPSARPALNDLLVRLRLGS